MSTPSSPPRKRPRSETLSADEDGFVRLGPHTLESIKSYLASLREAAVKPSIYADPSNCTSLIFPSLLRSSIELSRSSTGQCSFRHMGRPVFSSISDAVDKLDRNIMYPIVLCGTYGAGKSHLLSALASHLFAKGKRTVFIPDCPLVAEDPIFWLKLAFALAFADSPQAMHKILQFKTTGDFIEFSQSCHEEIYFLVDDYDRLEPDIKQTIAALGSSHLRVYTVTAPPRDLSNLPASAQIRIPSSIELAQWKQHFQNELPSCTDEIFSFIEYFTGGVPSLLRPLLQFAGQDFPDIATEFYSSRNFQRVMDNLIAFHDVQMEQLTDAQKSRYFTLMNSCLTETVPDIRPGANTMLYDPRYFEFDSEGRGHCICGLARDTMIPLLRLQDLGLFTSDAWYSSVRSGNIFTRHLGIIQICLTRIAIGGLTHADALGNAMRICTFRRDPLFSWMFEEAFRNAKGLSSFLCIPGPEVCRFLSGVIVRINPSDKTAQLIPIHVITPHTCNLLATTFFAVTWHDWERAIVEEGFKVMNTFVSINSGTPESVEIAERVRQFRVNVRFVSVEYNLREIDIGLLDPKIRRILDWQRESLSTQTS